VGKLEGKVAIVTGGGQGIGRGIVVALAKEGAKVAIAELNAKTCEEVVQEMRQLGREVLGVPCNVGDNAQVKRMVSEVVGKFGTVDILVNNAVGFVPNKPVEQIEEKHWDKSIQVNLKGVWYCCVAVFPYMKDRGGKVINISSSAGTIGLEGMGTYAATKEALKGLSRVAAKEWGKYKINVNIICPTAETPSSLHMPQEEYQAVIKRTPLGRWGDPEKDIGLVAVFLASVDSDFMTGQTLNVDGGNVFSL
jgi:NAD(P)-dependent dehydrogenase (short-subunit alcohol dehydrogenase family)